MLLDVRDPAELAIGDDRGRDQYPAARLRERMQRNPTDKRIVVYCQVGQRAYYACRILTPAGFDAVNLSGGYKTYSHAVWAQSNFDIFENV